MQAMFDNCQWQYFAENIKYFCWHHIDTLERGCQRCLHLSEVLMLVYTAFTTICWFIKDSQISTVSQCQMQWWILYCRYQTSVPCLRKTQGKRWETAVINGQSTERGRGFTRYSACRHRWDVRKQCSRGSGHLVIGSQYRHYLSWC